MEKNVAPPKIEPVLGHINPMWKVSFQGKVDYYETELGAIECGQAWLRMAKEDYVEQQRNVAFGMR